MGPTAAEPPPSCASVLHPHEAAWLAFLRATTLQAAGCSSSPQPSHSLAPADTWSGTAPAQACGVCCRSHGAPPGWAPWGCSQGCLCPGPGRLLTPSRLGTLPKWGSCLPGTPAAQGRGRGAWPTVWVLGLRGGGLVVTPRGGAEVLVPGPLWQLADTTRLVGSSFPSLPRAPVCWEAVRTLLSGGAMPCASNAEDLIQLCSQGLGGPSGGASGRWMAQGAAHRTRTCGRHLGDPARSEARAGSSAGSDGWGLWKQPEAMPPLSVLRCHSLAGDRGRSRPCPKPQAGP